jgi:hypothetical protein
VVPKSIPIILLMCQVLCPPYAGVIFIMSVV